MKTPKVLPRICCLSGLVGSAIYLAGGMMFFAIAQIAFWRLEERVATVAR